MKLTADKNGLAKVIQDKTNKITEVYYNQNKFEVVIYYLGATKEQIESLKLFVLKYISDNMLFRAYETVTIYS